MTRYHVWCPDDGEPEEEELHPDDAWPGDSAEDAVHAWAEERAEEDECFEETVCVAEASAEPVYPGDIENCRTFLVRTRTSFDVEEIKTRPAGAP